MTVREKQILITALALVFLVSLVLVQWREVIRREVELGLRPPDIAVPDASRECVECHADESPGVVAVWSDSGHAVNGVACVDCHKAERGEADAFDHYGVLMATVVTPRDCAPCHEAQFEEYQRSLHAAAADTLASLDHRLAGVVAGFAAPASEGRLEARAPVPARPELTTVDGRSDLVSGCGSCHGSKVALLARDGGTITVDDLDPDEAGRPRNRAAVERVRKDDKGQPMYDPRTWPNTGVGRVNLDGSLGSCSACHNRHDFARRRARRPEACGRCHLGPDHPQGEVYAESKHALAYRDRPRDMRLDGPTWVLGRDYLAAPTCATCHVSGHSRNGGKVTHDAGERISWTNRPVLSLPLDTDEAGRVVTETAPALRRELVTDSWEEKRTRMRNVCTHCHAPATVTGFFAQYDAFVLLYNEKFARPGLRIMEALLDQGLRTEAEFDEEIEWTWHALWHDEGRRARHGASMMAPEFADGRGLAEVARRFYLGLVPQARALCAQARAAGKAEQAGAVLALIDEILARPEHAWQAEGR